MNDNHDDEDREDWMAPSERPDWCPCCHGEGRVTTADYESYFGANYKPCPVCHGNPCAGEPDVSSGYPLYKKVIAERDRDHTPKGGLPETTGGNNISDGNNAASS